MAEIYRPYDTNSSALREINTTIGSLASLWIDEDDLKSQTISVEGLSGNDKIFVDLSEDEPTEDVRDSWSLIVSITLQGDNLLVKAADVPSADIPVKILAVRDAEDVTGLVPITIYASIGTTWVGSTAPYTQEITVTGVSSADNPVVGVVYSDTYSVAEAQKQAWSNIYRIKTDTNKIIIYATDVTDVEIPIQLGLRKEVMSNG